jgi:glutathione-regulated potassium-efflux system protein KefB
MAQQALLQLGFAASDVSMSIAKFRDHDLALLKLQRAVYLDQARLVQTSREASAELQSLFESDREEQPPQGPQRS